MLKFSFIIPAYNNKNLLANTLIALNMQKGYGIGDYEVIVVDDGSPERLIDFVSHIPQNYRLEYIYLDRTLSSCRAEARNKGISMAKGYIVIFLDSDMIVNENYLSEVERGFNLEQNICLISTRLYANREIEAPEIINKTVFNTFRFKDCKINYIENRHVVFNNSSYNASTVKTPWLFVYSCNMAVLKKNIQKIGGFDESYKGWGYEDIDLGYRLYKNGVKIVINHKMEAIHQYHGETALFFSWSMDKSKQLKNNKWDFLERHKEIEEVAPLLYKKRRFYLLQKFQESTFVSLNFFGLKKPDHCKTCKIFLTKSSKIKDIREMLHQKLTFSNDNNLICIYDYLENSDLDIWIQLIESSKCMVRYYPRSRSGKNFKIAVFSFLYILNGIALNVYQKLYSGFSRDRGGVY
ncbi:MAG TPA: glycosyltransferase [Pseudobacteroides sp.]|uniref:glycosyltransferase family 2 protein n=1 Tax=Pseudobacteroides sp. TaxID=1968840 RepID=UPI002F95BF9F